MSIAGIRSNRGDGYQTLVAFEWALTVLSDPEFQWIEVDSVTYLVDDIVIGKTDGTLICCQCKKNQIDFKAWTIADLADELHKAASLLVTNQNAEVRFYSRSPFGALAKLREHTTTQANEASYRASLSQEHQKVDAELATLLVNQNPNLSTYEFLCRTKFESSHELDRMEALLRERLRYMASNSRVAFDALWTRIDQLGARMDGGSSTASTQHRLTKDDLKAILHHAGAMLVPFLSIAEVRSSFASTSAIGRAWHRDIAGELIPSPTLNVLLAAIDDGKRSILLTGLPGSGKTCVMLNLQEVLEQRTQSRSDLVPLFIQSREFADLTTMQERQAQGLPEKWVEQAARLAEDAHVVVVIDSLDVLSIAREHSVLTYFLAQIDQLLLIPNITVITACRDFDRKYDRRIAVRQWDCEIQCQPLDWEIEVAPLLEKLGVDSSTIDHATRELIRNPRELALFVELAQREGSFNVVTSQALAQRYLDTIVQADPMLGDKAMQTIEAVADVMLQSRTLSIPRQRFSASQDILRRLHSLNILQDTHDGKLTFGHQTLLDVLVICGAIRRGVSLNEFILGLPPVPFVRPSIRSFVAQLVAGDRREFRRQLRTVLTGSAAFHIRRLVAESFAQQIPQDDDWPLMRDLRVNHREVFQVIYSQASSLEWHHFWLSHLVPALREMRDAEGMTLHVHRIGQWKNADAAGVLLFWVETIALDWLDGDRIADQLVYLLNDIKTEYLPLVVPLLELILSKPKPEHSLIGHIVARCISASAVDDTTLWLFIAGDIADDDVIAYSFGDKLHCQSHDFGEKNEDFLKKRMVHSTVLLDLTLATIEKWNQIKAAHYGETRIGYHHGYLSNTSYDDAHSQDDDRYVDGERLLFDAIEAAVLEHAKNNSEWWQQNRDRLCFNRDGALCYIAVLALTNFPQTNVDLIGRLLCDRNLLEFELTYELGTLIQNAFVYLDDHTQDAVIATIQTVWEESELDEGNRPWILRNRARYISAIPRHLRSVELQAILDSYEKIHGTLIRQPSIRSRGGWITAPFSYEVFLDASDGGVIRLLIHYTGYSRDFDDYLVGGEDQVGLQLREAASRHPSRYLRLLTKYWANISERFRDDAMDGITNYLAHRYGNLQINGNWAPIEEPDAPALAIQILDELERHPTHWQLNHSAARALKACAHVIQDAQNATRLLLLAIGFVGHNDEREVQGDSGDLIAAGYRMMSGNIAESLMILGNQLQDLGLAFPELFSPTLRRFASSENAAIRALILSRLPYLQHKNPRLGWELFHLATKDATGLWETAERCLYYAYYNNFEKVSPFLERIRREGSEKELKTWGRISALSALTGHIDFVKLLDELNSLNISEAWQGAASVWSHTGNIRQHHRQCLAGIEAGLNSPHSMAVAKRVDNIFRDEESPVSIPTELMSLFFRVFNSENDNKHHSFFGLHRWLNAISQRDPEAALTAAEIYLTYISRSKSYFHDHENQLIQLVTRLFAEAEEREDSDQGTMLRRVVSVQDLLLSLGVTSINDWLKAAERQ